MKHFGDHKTNAIRFTTKNNERFCKDKIPSKAYKLLFLFTAQKQ